MNITSSEKYILITAESNFNSVLKKLEETITNYNNNNIVLNLSDIHVSEKEIQSLINLAQIQIENNQSFVVIIPSFDADAFEDELNVVPTLIEAEDIIDMENISRDLGF